MSRLHLKNVVFPAVLLSCSIFSTLTLPFVLSDPNPVTVKLPPFFEGEIQPIFTSDNKTFTIRYIGAAIVASVGTGLLTIELLRRLQQQTQSSASKIAIHPAEFLSDGSDLDTFTPLPDLAEAFELKKDAEPNAAYSNITYPNTTYSEVAPFAAETDYGIAVLDEQGETCRIKVSDSEQTEFALMWNGDYYRFFRVRQTQDQALSIARKLARQGEQVVVSHLEHGYAVWVRASEAAAEFVSPVLL